MSGNGPAVISRRTTLLVACAALALLALAGARPAGAAISLQSFGGGIVDENGQPYRQAGGHPFQLTTEFRFDTLPGGKPVEDAKDIRVSLPPGLIGIPPAVPSCSPDYGTQKFFFGNPRAPLCPPETQVGYAEIELGGEYQPYKLPIYNLDPPAGVPARFGFTALTPDITLDGYVRPGDHGIDVVSRSTSQGLSLNWVRVTMWGVPADPQHTQSRACTNAQWYGCSSAANETPFLTLPMNCFAGPRKTTIRLNSWQNPDQYATASFDHEAGSGKPMTFEGCDQLVADPRVSIQPTTGSADAGSGLRFDLEMPQNPNPDGQDTAYLKKAVVTLPEGVTVNPSAAEGLGVCTPARYAAESVDAAPGAGCPVDSRIGSVEIESPALEGNLTGSLYQAQQDDPATAAPGAENPFDTLLGLYVVAESAERGVTVKLAGKVEPDPVTGRLTTTFDDLPQLPFTRFSLRFRDGARSVLVTPPACGTYSSVAEFTPWSAQDPDNPLPSEVLRRTSSFQVTSGAGGGPCPQAGAMPFAPGFGAGTASNNAGSYSPFSLRVVREDGMQELTRFSAQLPPGLLANLRGVPECPEAAIAAARSKSGRAELAAPSCPAGSQIGTLLAGAGVGPVLTYVPGKLYLGGPIAGAPLSVVAVTPAVAGPFDVGTVVVREALRVDPLTAEVEVDGAASDPIPRILRGIPLELRDLRVDVDRNRFTVNPTSCDPMSVGAKLFGSAGSLAGPSSRFQAAGCERLAFKPKLSLRLKGATKRSGHPQLTAVLTQKPGGANIARASVAMPRSEFLAQDHIRTVCTRVQFAASACPEGSIYGRARAFSPLLDQPLEGPVYLRSSDNTLPDLVADLRGRIDIELVGRIDSLNGGIRTTFDTVPDAPVTRFVLKMQGGKRSLLENSENLCASKNRATVKMDAHNGKLRDFRPLVRASCGRGGQR